MKTFIAIVIATFISSSSYALKFDFGESTDSMGWIIINDDVMGGRSSSVLSIKENSIVFKGNLSLENNGGFASFRTPNGDFDLSKFNKVKIRYKSDSRSFALRLENYRMFYRPYYKQALGSSGNNWETIELSLSDFKAYRLGRMIDDNMPQKQLEDIIRIGIILNDKQEGPFEIEIDYIEFL